MLAMLPFNFGAFGFQFLSKVYVSPKITKLNIVHAYESVDQLEKCVTMTAGHTKAI